MLFCVLLILATWNAVLGRTDTCDDPSNRSCPKPEEAKRFPKTEEDINRLCPKLAQNLECLKDYADKCGYENIVHQDFSQDKYHSLKNLLEDICRKDSQLHLRTVQNIGCISELLDSYPQECRVKLQNKTRMLGQYAWNKEAEGNFNEYTYKFELEMPYLCVINSLRIACFSSETSRRCGSDAEDVVLEVIDRSETIKDVCSSPVSRDRVYEFIKNLELEIEEERFLKELINKE